MSIVFLFDRCISIKKENIIGKIRGKIDKMKFFLDNFDLCMLEDKERELKVRWKDWSVRERGDNGSSKVEKGSRENKWKYR